MFIKNEFMNLCIIQGIKQIFVHLLMKLLLKVLELQALWGT